MTHAFMGNSLWQLVTHADATSKFVLVTLLSMSIICWAITLYKIALLRVKRQQVREMLSALQNVTNIHELMALGVTMQETMPGFIISRGAVALKSLLQTPEGHKSTLNDYEFELLRNALNQALDDAMHREEEYLSVLSTSAAIAPLIGLFGTVWGLIHSFIRISEQQSADIATVAPGIAEALITTLAGLLVAIPAMIMFHYIIGNVRAIEHQLVAVSDRFEWIVKKVLVK